MEIYRYRAHPSRGHFPSVGESVTYRGGPGEVVCEVVGMSGEKTSSPTFVLKVTGTNRYFKKGQTIASPAEFLRKRATRHSKTY